MKLLLLFISSFIFSIGYSQTFVVGEQIMAFEDDDELYYKATILEVRDGECKIHWEGFSSEYDEVKRNICFWKPGIPFMEKDELQGLQNDGKWYNVKINWLSQQTSNKYHVRWGGFEGIDRWISGDSLRLPTKENYIAEGNFKIARDAKSTESSNTSSDTRISIVYLENKTGADIKYSFSGDGSSGGSSIFKNQSANIKNAPIGGTINVNGKFYIKITKEHDGQTIIIR